MTAPARQNRALFLGTNSNGFFFRPRFVLPESPRWLLCKGRIAEVKEIVKKAAAFNNRPLPDNLDKLLKPPTDEEETGAGVCELFRTKYLRLVTFCFLCIWFTMNLVYYGLVLNMNSFGGNIYLNSVSVARHMCVATVA